MKILESREIVLRALEPEDLELLYQWENESEFWYTSGRQSPLSRFQLKQYIAQAEFDIFANNQLRFVIQSREEKRAIGTVDLFDFDIYHSRVALGLYVDKSARGKGYARMALEMVERYVFDYLQVHQLYVQISEKNPDSRRLFERDYLLCATFKEWIRDGKNYHDLLTFQKINKG